MSREKNMRKNTSPDPSGYHPNLSVVDIKFLELFEHLTREAKINNEGPKSGRAFAEMIGVYPAFISHMKNRGRSVTVEQLCKTALKFNIDMNWFIRDNSPMRYQEPSDNNDAKKEDNEFTNGSIDTNSIKQLLYQGNVLFEQFAEQIVREAPEKLKEKVRLLVIETTEIRKLVLKFQQEIIEWKEKCKELENERKGLSSLLNKSNADLVASKDKVIGMYEATT